MDRLKELLPSEIKRFEILFDKWLSKQIYTNTDELIELIEMTIQQIDSVLIKLEFHKQQTKDSNPMDYDEEYFLHITELVKENENQKEYWRYRLNELCTKKVQTSTVKTSYKWQGNPDELPKLHKLMIDKYKLIGPETTLGQFKAVFTGQPIESINPIKWEMAKNLNAYFLEQLFDKKKLYKAHNPDIWDIAKYCFSDGTNFGQLVELYKNNKTGKPKNHNLIDDLLEAL